MHYSSVFSGFGGQGIMLIGDILAHTAMREGYFVTYFPSYGVEMRGGTANCTVIISSKQIGSPITATPMAVIAMNGPAVEKYQPLVKSNGLLMVNENLVEKSLLTRKDIEIVIIPASEMAAEVATDKIANMIMLGAFVAKTKVVRFDKMISYLDEIFPIKYKNTIPDNVAALEKGYNFFHI